MFCRFATTASRPAESVGFFSRCDQGTRATRICACTRMFPAIPPGCKCVMALHTALFDLVESILVCDSHKDHMKGKMTPSRQPVNG